MNQITLNHYLKIAESHGITPNFYLSVPYLQLSQSRVKTDGHYIWVVSEGWCLFPPLLIKGSGTWHYPVLRSWSDFDGVLSVCRKQKFLDWEYIFDPGKFKDLSGGRWEVFRKNIRKWPKRNEKWTYSNIPPDPMAAGNLIANWLIEKGDDAQDADLMADFAYFSKVPNIFRKYLYNSNGDLVGINAWDENYQYVNYRVCIVDFTEAYLDEFMRYLFYTDNIIEETGKMINDGGTLDNPGLERFKDKMNPIKKRKVHTLIY